MTNNSSVSYNSFASCQTEVEVWLDYPNPKLLQAARVLDAYEILQEQSPLFKLQTALCAAESPSPSKTTYLSFSNDQHTSASLMTNIPQLL
ncbi:hypothetical protein Pmani_000211 [Petrolisthes manimaculis]|uniref:Uncharacterized protein n=1 Tax=Petrolisthes manimaculis TaxID=1843537 RepID=A0AAE1QM60_9EUCA|nr:hypothetical protein Pmani_000211 [Petrolisthes manimaculis]